MSSRRRIALLLPMLGLAVPAVALALTLLVLGWGRASPTALAVPFPGDGTAELHIDVTGVSGCSTGALAGPNDVKGVCNIPTGGAFTVNGYIDNMGAGATSYEALQVQLDYAGVTSKDNPSTASWPDCVYAASFGQGSGLYILAGCGRGQFAPNSTYLGKVFTNSFNCPQTPADGTIIMTHGLGTTKIVETVSGPGIRHTDGGPDVLNIHCVAAPVGGISIDGGIGALPPRTGGSQAGLLAAAITGGALVVSLGIGVAARRSRRRQGR